ncbi:MAG TPA: RNA methyltransferase [Candidatus Acidoferrum sp.]|nr:RNA methyltransferase [Candidatus Acidoferrum sp.]
MERILHQRLFLIDFVLKVLLSLFESTFPAVHSFPMLFSLNNLRVVLVAPRNPLNIGAAARAMSNFGFMHLRVVNPYEVAFRDAKSAVGASPVLQSAQEFKTIAEAIADCAVAVGTTAIRHRQPRQPVKQLPQAARSIAGKLAHANVALLFGSEKWGLSNEDLSHCHWLLHIPTRGEHQSMNLGQAVAVCLYELIRNQAVKTPAIGKKDHLATLDVVERITQTLLSVLRESEYINPKTGRLAEEKLRRLIRRMHLEAADAEVLLGMFHKISWKLGRSGKTKA